MRAGLVSVTFRGLGPEAIIDLAAACGLEAIEWGGDVHAPCGDLRTARRVGERSRARGLETACYGSYCRLTNEERERGVFEATVETALALGAPLIRVWAGPWGSGEADARQREMVTENARVLGDLAARADLDVAFEYHGNTLTDDCASALDLLRRVDRPNVGCLWQPPVDMPAEDCVRAIRALRGYVRNIHVFSWRGTERLPLAEGAEKWRKCLAEIAALPGERCLLLEFVRGDDPEQLRAYARCLQRWMKGDWT